MSYFLKNYVKLLFSLLLFLVAFLFLGCDAERQDTPEPLAAVNEANMGPNRPNSAYHNKILAEVRRATVHYKDVAAAEAAGYVLVNHCASSPAGGMGYHYVNAALIFDGTIDPSQPEALVYEPQKNGKLKLVAVEYIVDAASWHAMHNTTPMLGDQAFDNFISLVGNPLGFPHYQLHVWVWKHNPAGMHAAFNPNVTCEYAMH
jgi:hypothetical protein